MARRRGPPGVTGSLALGDSHRAKETRPRRRTRGHIHPVRHGGRSVALLTHPQRVGCINAAPVGEPVNLHAKPSLRTPHGWIHRYPSQLGPTQVRTTSKVAVDAVRALGLRDGIAFPQLLATDAGEVFVVEVAARIPAGQMADLVRLGTGVDLVEIALTQASGHVVSDSMIEPRYHRPLAIRFLTASPGILPLGRVVAVAGLDRVRAAPGVLQADLYIQIGETIRPVQVDADRRGYVIATADDANAALELAQQASHELQVEVARP